MKFTKEQAFEKLKGELTKNGKALRSSERTINAHLDTLMSLVANDETELDKFVESILPAFVSLEGNIEKEKSDFIKSYKPATSTVTTPSTPTGQVAKTDDDAIALIKKELDELKQKTLQHELEQKKSATTKAFVKKLKEKGIKDESWLNELLPEVNITEDFNVDEKAEKYVKLYNLSHAETPAGLTPQGTNTPTSSKIDWSDVNKDLKK